MASGDPADKGAEPALDPDVYLSTIVDPPIDEGLWGEPPTMTAADVAAAIGVDEHHVRRVWQLFGFADPEGRTVFFPADVELLRVQSQGVAFFGDEPVEHMTRAVGSGTRSILEATI